MKAWYWRNRPRLQRWFIGGLRQFGLTARLNLQLSVSLHSRSFKVPLLAGIGLRNVRMSEMWMIPLLQKLAPMKSGIFIDVGVNIGQTLLKLRAVSDCPWVGFEPNPACVFYVQELIRANKFVDATIVPIGLLDASGLVELKFFDEGNRVDSGASLANRERVRPVICRWYVPVFPWRDVKPLLPPGRRVGILKIDVEGAEMEVLQTVGELLDTDRPAVLLEILPDQVESNAGRKAERIQHYLDQRRYALYRILKAGGRFAGIALVDAVGFGSVEGEWDYLAVPAEGRREVENSLLTTAENRSVQPT